MISISKAPRYLILSYACTEMLFLIPVILLFYGYKGVGIGDFFFIQGLCWLFVFALEIPTGYIADLFSRRNTLIAGCLAFILGYLFWFYGSGFGWILAGELTFSVAISLMSGTTEAYLYDLLKRQHKENKIHQKLSKLQTISGIAMIITTFSGAFLYQFMGADLTLWLTIMFVLVGMAILCFLPDVPEARRKVDANKSKLQDIMDISKYAISHPQIKWLIIYPAIYGTLTLIFVWGLQPVMMSTGVPVLMFSVVMGVNSVARTGWAAISGKMLDKFGLNRIIKILFGIVCIASVGAVLSTQVPFEWVYVCLGLMILGSGSIILARVVTSTLINHRIRSDERATVLSVSSMAGRFVAGCAMLLLKPLFDYVGIGKTFLISAILLLPIAWASYYLLKLKLKVKEV